MAFLVLLMLLNVLVTILVAQFQAVPGNYENTKFVERRLLVLLQPVVCQFVLRACGKHVLGRDVYPILHGVLPLCKCAFWSGNDRRRANFSPVLVFLLWKNQLECRHEL